MHPLIPRLRAARIIPVVRASSAARAATAVAWLQEAGITVFEITMTVPEAPALIRALAQDPALLVGAGTVPDARTAETCLEAGAKFIVAPWVDATLASPCQDAGACLMLGAMTPTEVRAALESIEAPAADDPLRGADRAELRRLVHSVLDRLPNRYGEALEWKYVEGRSVEEIGERLGIGHTAAQSLLARARVAFREGVEAVFGASASDVLASLGA